MLISGAKWVPNTKQVTIALTLINCQVNGDYTYFKGKNEEGVWKFKIYTGTDKTKEIQYTDVLNQLNDFEEHDLDKESIEDIINSHAGEALVVKTVKSDTLNPNANVDAGDSEFFYNISLK